MSQMPPPSAPPSPGPRRGRPPATEDKTAQNTIRALDRALALLHHLARARGLGLSDIARIADEAPATVYRMLTTMAQHRIVELEAGPQLWHIGPGAFQLGAAFAARTDLGALAAPVMAELTARLGETVTLAIPQEGAMLILRHADSAQALRAHLPMGMRLPLHASASGKALLAFGPAEILETLLDASLKPLTGATITNPALLRADLSGARKQGHASDDQEFIEGLRSVAAPVRGPEGQVIAALAITAPTIRFTPGAFARFGQAAQNAADRLTNALGSPAQDR